MKIFKIMALTLVAMCGFGSCSEDCNHDFIEVNYSKDIVGTWTCLEPDHSAVYIFNADGTLSTTGVDSEGYWEDVKGTYKVVNNKITMKFESGRNINGSFDIIPGQTISIVGEKGRHTYQYCTNDLSDEIVGMWVCNDGLTGEAGDMTIQTFTEDGKAFFTGGLAIEGSDSFLKIETSYTVVGDLIFQQMPADPTNNGPDMYKVSRLTYAPKGTSLGDIMTQKMYLPTADGIEEIVSSYLRVNQSLDLEGQKYDHIKTYVSNVKGEDKEINFMGYTFNFAKMDGSGLDKMLKALLFNVEFADANSIIYSYQMNGKKESFNAPIVVEGNKMTIKMSAKVPTLKDVVFYAFQDADCSQMHFYMHKTAFVNFYTNMQAMLLAGTDEQFDITNADVVNAIYDNINNAVETINVSLVMSKAAK